MERDPCLMQNGQGFIIYKQINTMGEYLTQLKRLTEGQVF